MIAERSDVLVFNVYTGELRTIAMGGTYPDGYLPVFDNIQPRFDIDGNYIGCTLDDSGVIATLTSPDKLIKELRKGMKRWVYIGLASVVLLIITALQIYYNLGYGALPRFLAVVQFALLVTAIVFFMKTKRLFLSFRQEHAQ